MAPKEGKGGGKGPAEPKRGDRGELAGLRSRPDLNGRRVEVRGTATGKDGAPRLAVRLLFGAGAGTVLKVKPANLQICAEVNALVGTMESLENEDRPDWAGLPVHVLAKVAEKVVAQNEGLYEAYLRRTAFLDEVGIQATMESRKRGGHCLFLFAMVCKNWHVAAEQATASPQLEVEGQMLIRSVDIVLLQPAEGVELVKWALAEGCEGTRGGLQEMYNLPTFAAEQGNLMLVRWLSLDMEFRISDMTLGMASFSGNLELLQWLEDATVGGRHMGAPVFTEGACIQAARGGQLEALQWLRAHGCPWEKGTCRAAAKYGHEEVLRWARENGAPWTAYWRDAAAEKFEYTDDFGNVVYGIGDE